MHVIYVYKYMLYMSRAGIELSIQNRQVWCLYWWHCLQIA